MERITRKKIRDFNRDIIELTVRKADKLPVKIAEPQEEIKVDASATTMISPDKMKGYITLSPPDNGRMLTLDEIVGILNSNGIIYGINKATLESLVKYPIYNEMICIAEGTPPINGQNGKVKFNFDITRESKPTILEDGKVDSENLI